MRVLLSIAAVAAVVTAVSCGSQEVQNLRQYSDAVSEQNQQVKNQDQTGAPASSNDTGSSDQPSDTPAKEPAGETPGTGGDSPDTPKPPTTIDPTKGDNVASLRFKTSCYQPGNESCFLHQASSNNSGFYERLCRQGARDAKVTKGSNACAELKISAKCSVNFRGDKLIFYNIGALTKAKDKQLTDTCAGTEVLGQVIRGTYERFETPKD